LQEEKIQEKIKSTHTIVIPDFSLLRLIFSFIFGSKFETSAFSAGLYVPPGLI